MPDWKTLLPTRPNEFVEIFCIAVLLYLVLRLVRGTIAGSILRGVMIMVLLGALLTAFLVKQFELLVLGAILKSLATYILFALLLVFQPEMRRGLLSLGEYPLLRAWAPRVKGCEDEIAAAVESLVRDKHGALLCIERYNALHHIAKTGVPLDSEVRAELLVSIFWPGNPLHDGGVILRGDRIVAAACILPVTERRDIATRLGTRHRAGIGLSEESDAIVLIVSEETGRVSLAVEGHLTQVEDRSQLADTLRKLRGLTPASGESAAQVALAASASGIIAAPEPGADDPSAGGEDAGGDDENEERHK